MLSVVQKIKVFDCYGFLNWFVAQLAEYSAFNRGVVSSNLTGPTLLSSVMATYQSLTLALMVRVHPQQQMVVLAYW